MGKRLDRWEFICLNIGKNVKKCRVDQSKLTEYVWEEQHRILWNKVDLVGRGTNMFKRNVVETSLFATVVNALS